MSALDPTLPDETLTCTKSHRYLSEVWSRQDACRTASVAPATGQEILSHTIVRTACSRSASPSGQIAPRPPLVITEFAALIALPCTVSCYSQLASIRSGLLLLLTGASRSDSQDSHTLETNCQIANLRNWSLMIATITQSLENAGREILRYSLNLVFAWYEGTKFTPSNLDGITILIPESKPASVRLP